MGQRKTSIGWQLWWNWELDRTHYPTWEADRKSLEAQGIKLLTYVNPFLADVSTKGACERDLLTEARKLGFLVRTKRNTPYAVANTSFSAYMLDLANPECRDWFKSVLTERVLSVGASGFMADFAEALPCDAVIAGEISSEVYHNEYPVVWSALVGEVLNEVLGDEGVAFHRSGFTKSPRYARLFWLGDQLVSWAPEDGIKSAVVGLLSSGLCGFSLNHSDIGGYTSTDLLPFGLKVNGVSFIRTEELLMRWIELNAFTAIFRTHEGNQPSKNIQIDDHERITAFFAYFSRVYSALFDYRRAEMNVMHENGVPLVCPIWFYAPDDRKALRIDDAFTLGRYIYVYPVLSSNTSRRTVYLPKGHYRHAFTNRVFAGGTEHQVAAPLGTPAVFIRDDCPQQAAIIECFQQLQHEMLTRSSVPG